MLAVFEWAMRIITFPDGFLAPYGKWYFVIRRSNEANPRRLRVPKLPSPGEPARRARTTANRADAEHRHRRRRRHTQQHQTARESRTDRAGGGRKSQADCRRGRGLLSPLNRSEERRVGKECR